MATAAKERLEEGTVEEPEDDKPVPRKPTVKANDEDGTKTVDLGDEDPAPRKPRRERRAERQDDEVSRVRAELAAERERRAVLESQVARGFQDLHQRVSQPQEDPYRKRVASIREEQESIQTMIRNGALTDPAAVERARQRFYALNDEAEELAQERIITRATERMARQQPQQSTAAEEALIRSEFPDVLANQAATRFAVGEYHRLTAKGEPATLATTRKAMQAAAEEFQIRRPTVPQLPPSQQQRYGAINAQAGARTSGTEIRLDKAQLKMAAARWPDLDEDQQAIRMSALLRNAEKDQPQE